MRALPVAFAAAIPAAVAVWAVIASDEPLLARARSNDVLPRSMDLSAAQADTRFVYATDPEDDAVIGRIARLPVEREAAIDACPTMWAAEHGSTHVFRYVGASKPVETEHSWERSVDLLIVIGCAYVQENRAACSVDKETGVVRMTETVVRTLPGTACDEESVFEKIKRMVSR